MKSIYKIFILLGIGISLLFVGIGMGGLRHMSLARVFPSFSFDTRNEERRHSYFKGTAEIAEIEFNLSYAKVEYYEKEGLETMEVVAEDAYHDFNVIYDYVNERAIISQPRYVQSLFSTNQVEQTIIKVYVPADDSIENIEINASLGIVDFHGLKAKKIDVMNMMGKYTLNDIQCDYFIVDGKMGEVSINQLDIQKAVRVKTSMGATSLRLVGMEEEYNYYAQVGLGQVDIGSQSISGVDAIEKMRNNGSKFIDVQCGMGSVEIEMED